jgi:hydroxyacylglutathione hydrolase
MNITIIPVLKDNYSYVIDDGHGHITVVDPGEAEPIINYLTANDLILNTILNTHHHGDHVAGNAALKSKYGAQIFAPASEADKIGDIDIAVHNEDTVQCGKVSFLAIETPGHTLGHLCFYAADHDALFSGDTLFSMGCGRLFEGTYEQMHHSLQTLAELPDQTQIYCGHEYTQSNAAFCLSVDPDNEALKARNNQIQELRAQNKPTLPVTLSIEKRTNVFLNAKSANDFKRLRLLKDNS